MRRASHMAVAACLWLAAGCKGSIDSGTPFQGANGGGAAADSGGPGATSAANGGVPTTNCDQAGLPPRRLWRLTPTQYDNTVSDLFGIQSTYGAGFPADEAGAGFSNASDSLRMNPLLADKLQAAAKDIASKVDLGKIDACATAQKDDACTSDFVAQLGGRVFRRPLTAADVNRYTTLAKSAGDFETGARLVVNAMLQSPYFLYRFELGTQQSPNGPYQLDDYEVASELSYMLWQTMPDDTLLAAAKAGQLHTAAQVSQQVDRMLHDQRAKPVVREFIFDWLGLGTITDVPKDPGSFPDLTDSIRNDMVAEAQRFVDHVMFEEDGSIQSLLTSPTTYLNAELAKFYGVQLPAASANASDLQAVDMSAQDRQGVLTLGGVLLTHSRSNDSSPVERGKLVREQFLCQPMPPPPAGLALQPPGLDPTKTTRERYAEHADNPVCATCHNLMDPMGLAFERWDGVGRFRQNENGLPIDVSGQVISNTPTDVDGPFNGTDELIGKLDKSETVRACYALEWFRFAYGEGSDPRAMPSCYAQKFQAAAAKGDGSLASMVTLLTQSDWILQRSAAPNDPLTMDDSTTAASSDGTPPSMQAGSAAPTAGSSADAGMPMNQLPPGLTLTLSNNNSWDTGYCDTYQLHNTSSAPITWSVPVTVKGMMNQHWECNVSGSTGQVTFTGADFNASIAPDGMAEFGFCAVTN